MSKAAARLGDPVVHPLPPVLTGGPGSFDVLIGGKPAWRGIPAASAAALQVAKKASDLAIKTAEAATLAAAGTPAAPGFKAAEETTKATAASTMGSMISGMAMGADIHSCTTPLPVPPHGPGVVIDGSATVLINGLPACRMGDTIVEAVGPPNKIAMGCPTVLIGGGSVSTPLSTGLKNSRSAVPLQYNGPQLSADQGATTYTIGPPTRPDIPFDSGFSNLPKESPTLADYATRAKWEAAARGVSVPNPVRYMPDGADAYLHYLYGGGADRTFSYDKFVRDDPSGTTILNNSIADAQAGAEDLYNQMISQNPGLKGQPVSFEMTSGVITAGGSNDFPYPETENWQKAIGGHSTWTSATVTVTPSQAGQPPAYQMDYTLHAEDRYNFDPGKADIASGAPDAENGRLVVVGLADEYTNSSTLSRDVGWEQGNVDKTSVSGGSTR